MDRTPILKLGNALPGTRQDFIQMLAVLKQGGQYVLALKGNQGKLFNAVARRFARAGKRSVAARIEPSTHDRREACAMAMVA